MLTSLSVEQLRMLPSAKDWERLYVNANSMRIVVLNCRIELSCVDRKALLIWIQACDFCLPIWVLSKHSTYEDFRSGFFRAESAFHSCSTRLEKYFEYWTSTTIFSHFEHFRTQKPSNIYFAKSSFPHSRRLQYPYFLQNTAQRSHTFWIFSIFHIFEFEAPHIIAFRTSS